MKADKPKEEVPINQDWNYNEDARNYAEGKMPMNWDRTYTESVGLFYKYFIEYLQASQPKVSEVDVEDKLRYERNMFQDLFVKAQEEISLLKSQSNLVEEREVLYRWVKASERLPDKRGEENSVIIRDTVKKWVSKGFTNFDDKKPQIYFVLGSKSYLTTEGEGNNNSTYPIDKIEWLEPINQPLEKQELKLAEYQINYYEEKIEMLQRILNDKDAEIEKFELDLKEAAGLLLIDITNVHPHSDLSKVISANSILRQKVSANDFEKQEGEVSAEEILRKHILKQAEKDKDFDINDIDDESMQTAINAMKEYASQKVSEYKNSIK